MPLTPYNDESLNLEILAEEAAEVIQIKSKVVRFGMDDFHPKNEVVNRHALEREIGHFLVMVDILVDQGSISLDGIEAGKAHKLRRMPDWYFAGNSRRLLQSCTDNPTAAAEMLARLEDNAPCVFNKTCAGDSCHLPDQRCNLYKPLVGPTPVTDQQWPRPCASNPSTDCKCVPPSDCKCHG